MYESGKIKLFSKDLLTELKSFIRHEGAYAAQTGSTDDRVMACIIAIYILQWLAQTDERAYSVSYSQADEIEKRHNLKMSIPEQENKEEYTNFIGMMVG